MARSTYLRVESVNQKNGQSAKQMFVSDVVDKPEARKLTYFYQCSQYPTPRVVGDNGGTLPLAAALDVAKRAGDRCGFKRGEPCRLWPILDDLVARWVMPPSPPLKRFSITSAAEASDVSRRKAVGMSPI